MDLISPKIVVENVSFSYGDLLVLEEISFAVPRGQVLAILGPSGCGKSTLLRIIAGLMRPRSGEIYFDGVRHTAVPGDAGLMFQKPLLLPWKTLFGNLLVPLRFRGYGRREAKKRAEACLHEFRLSQFADYYPHQLSGGMSQRGALMRAYLYQGDPLLLDEPLGSLDAITREGMQQWLLGVVERLSSTLILVTHDVTEALFLADRLLVISLSPSKILRDITLPFAHPRERELKRSAEFLSLEREILAHLAPPEKKHESRIPSS